MPTLTLYRTRCGRWPAGPPTTELADFLPGTERSCESCLRIVVRELDDDHPTPSSAGVTWIRRRPGLSWHALIPNYQDADPKYLPAQFQGPEGVQGIQDANLPEPVALHQAGSHLGAVSALGGPVASLGVTGTLTGVAGPAREPGETDDDIRRKAGVTV